MKIVFLCSSAVAINCSRINWSICSANSNEIQTLLRATDLYTIECSKHNYRFNFIGYSLEEEEDHFDFPETNMLMQLMPGESNIFYLKVALREYVNTFTVINCNGDRVYPEDID